jgi:hypothetical protein
MRGRENLHQMNTIYGALGYTRYTLRKGKNGYAFRNR